MIHLYVKTHNDTGLKYLGKTVSQNPEEYQGSGVRWKNHIKKHGYNVSTEILLSSDNPELIKEKGIYYSNLWNVVESNEWANLKEEQGDGGWDYINNDPNIRQKRSDRMSGEKNIMFGSSRRGAENPFYDKNHTEDSKHKISTSKKGVKLGQQTKEQISKRLGKNICPTCGKEIGGGNGNLVIHMKGSKCTPNINSVK